MFVLSFILAGSKICSLANECTAFLAIRMIQRFGNSNPSPGLIERVATAYKTGSFGQFGSNKYGDLGAMVAAILLDEESRSVVLDADQISGHLREPLIKVLSFFRR